MILIVSALMLEARPIREGLGLEALGDEPFPVFTGEKAILVVSGTGALKASAATAWAMARFPGIRAAANIGFAGAPERVSPLYRWHFIHAVRDQGNGRLYIPDVLIRHPFEEAQLLTVGKVAKEDFGWNGLVDMEGSGFYEAARQFLAPDRIALFKWVSDHLTGTIHAKEIGRQFHDGLGCILDFLGDWPTGEEDPLTAPPDELADTILGKLRLSRTQTLFLRKWVQGYLSRGGDAEAVLALLPEQIPPGKKDNTRLLEELKDALKG
jgi:hypothetical protein